MAGNDDTTQVEFYSPWPKFGCSLNEQWGELRTDTAHLAPIVRGVGLDSDGDFSTLDDVEQTAVMAWEVGEDGFHNKFRMHWNKTDALFELQSNIPPGTSEVPNWYTVWSVSDGGTVAQQTSATTGLSVGTGAEVYKTKVGTQLQFRSILGSGVITATENSNDITITSSAEANTASSLGGTSIYGSKSGVDLRFKGLTAGSNMSLADDGTQLTLSSTSQIVEFYGIVVANSDDTFIKPSAHVLKFNIENFYVTGATSNKEAMVNLRGDSFNPNLYVAIAGDTMTGALLHPDGAVGAPAVSFSGDTDTGIFRNADDDMALVSGGTSVLRALSDRVYLPLDLQVASGGTAASPDIYFFPDSDTGIFQQETGSIAFATDGTRAGWFTNNQDFYVSNHIYTGSGSANRPSYSFGSVPTTGLSVNTSNAALNLTAKGVTGLVVAADQVYPTLPIRTNASGSASAPRYSFNGDSDTGIYVNDPTFAVKTLDFAVNGARAGYFTDDDSLYVTNQFFSNATAATPASPNYAFTADPDSGLYIQGDAHLRMGIAGNYIQSWQATGSYFAQPIAFNYNFGAISADPSTPVFTFFPDFDTGIYQNASGDGSIAFSTDGTRAGYFDTNNDLYVTNNVYVATEVYGAGWNGSLSVPTKDAVYDKIESLAEESTTASNLGSGAGVFFQKTGSDLEFKSIRGQDQTVSITNSVDEIFVSATGTFYTPVSVEGADPTLTVGSGGATDSVLKFYDEGTLAYTLGWDESASAFKIASGVMDDTNDEVTITDELVEVKHKLHAGRVEAGYGYFYATSGDSFVAHPFVRAGKDNNETNFATPQLTFDGDGIARASGLGFNHFNNYPFFSYNGSLRMFWSGSYCASAVQFRVYPAGVTTPQFAFQSDTDTGMWSESSGANGGANSLDVAHLVAGGVSQAWWGTDGFHADKIFSDDTIAAGRVEAGYGEFYATITMTGGDLQQFLLPNPSNSGGTYPDKDTPSISFGNNTDCGLYQNAMNDIRFAVNSVDVWIAQNSGFIAPILQASSSGSVGVPSLTFFSDLNTGLYQIAAGDDSLAITTGGTQAGYFDSNQDFFLTNGNLNLSEGLIATPDEITATSEGVAASLTTVNTEVTTNGDSDLDNVTLANGTSGQIKNIYCVVEGNAADTWKITPATMVGGTQITFAGAGEGCTLVYANNEGWVVVANNGGTIT